LIRGNTSQDRVAELPQSHLLKRFNQVQKDARHNGFEKGMATAIDPVLQIADIAFAYSADPLGQYLYVGGKGPKELLGYAPDELVGKFIFDLIPEADQARTAQELQSMAKNHRAFIGPWPALHKDGSRVTLNIFSYPTFDPDGRVSRYYGMGLLADNTLGWAPADEETRELVREATSVETRLVTAAKKFFSYVPVKLSAWKYIPDHESYYYLGSNRLLEKDAAKVLRPGDTYDDYVKKYHPGGRRHGFLDTAMQTGQVQSARVKSTNHETHELHWYKATYIPLQSENIVLVASQDDGPVDRREAVRLQNLKMAQLLELNQKIGRKIVLDVVAIVMGFLTVVAVGVWAIFNF